MRRRHPAAPLDATLGDLAEVIVELSPSDYASVARGFPSSIGSHVRHILDHVAALLSGVDTGRIDYDTRERGTRVETNRNEALKRIAETRNALRDAALEALLEAGVTVVDRHDPECDRIVVGSSIAREMAYVLSHTTHHNAIIRAIAETRGRNVPAFFGFAPSTVAHLLAAAG